LISHDLGLNFAPWNFYEREVINIDGEFHVGNRLKNIKENFTTLKFVHFSGFDYRGMLNSEVNQGNIISLKIYPDVIQILDEYGQWLKQSDFLAFANLKYSYDTFSNGEPISKTYRKLYRRLIEDGGQALNPFDSNESFYKSLKNSNLLQVGMASGDKKGIGQIGGAEKKLILINKFLKFVFKLVGSERFFMLVRLLRLYSKVENHVYLIDSSYLKESKIRD